MFNKTETVIKREQVIKKGVTKELFYIVDIVKNIFGKIIKEYIYGTPTRYLYKKENSNLYTIQISSEITNIDVAIFILNKKKYPIDKFKGNNIYYGFLPEDNYKPVYFLDNYEEYQKIFYSIKEIQNYILAEKQYILDIQYL
jgi:hypothetical protein